MIIAIDGPAGSGKSTIAREVAKRLGMHYLDTGAMYRTVALLALEAGLVPDRIPEAAGLAAKSDLRFVERPDDLTRVFIGDREVTDEIRGRQVSQAVSPVSADGAVRALMTGRQREEASRGDVVLEGRDIGTVVFPNAELKVYLVASVEERARRRRAQLLAQGVDQPVDQIVSDIAARDAYDSGRALAPLRKADDAVEIDTTGMTIPEVIQAVSALVEAKRPAAAAGEGQPVTPPPGAAKPPTPAQHSASEPAKSGKKWPPSRMVRGPLDTWLYRFAFSFIPPVWRCLFRMKIKGAENIPRTGAVLLVSNHRSNLDPFFVGVAFPRQIHFMAKAELWKVKALGRLIDLLGTFPVNRGEADRNAVKRALDMLAAGAVVGMFPEGHRQRSGQLGEIQAGVSLFALRDGVATVPMIVDGTERVVRKGLLRLTRVTVTFGPPLELPGNDMPRAQRSLLVTERLNRAFRDLLAPSMETP
jgi:cytidylate kinase